MDAWGGHNGIKIIIPAASQCVCAIQNQRHIRAGLNIKGGAGGFRAINGDVT